MFLILGILGFNFDSLVLCWAILASCWSLLGPSWGPLGAWPHVGPSWDHLGTILGPSWGPHRLSWDDLGGPSGRRRRCKDEQSESAENIRFPKGMGRFLLLWALLGGLLEASWSVLEAS